MTRDGASRDTLGTRTYETIEIDNRSEAFHTCHKERRCRLFVTWCTNDRVPVGLGRVPSWAGVKSYRDLENHKHLFDC